MSTLSGIVSKGEKGKTKYQSIDINSLYRSSRGESLEQHQQKNTVPRKHGMQSLGKVPSARRPPANLPSLRSETSSSDPAVSLVPSGGSGWATTKESTPTTSTVTTTTPSDNTTTNSAPAQCTTGPTPASLTPQQHPPLPGQQSSLQTPHPSEAGNKSSWSAIMSRSGDAGGGPPNQQQQTQPNREMNAQYGPGPSLRPQTEGSWIQGGSRITGGQNTGVVAGVAGSGNIQVGPGPQFGPGQPEPLAGGRPNLVQSPGMATVPVGQGPQNNQAQISAGQVGPNMHHYRGIIPPFMYKGNFPSGNFPAQFPAGGPRPRFNYPAERSPTQQQQQQQQPPQQRGDRGGAQPPAEEEIQTRPIIKEEDLSRMDDISRDAGWTASDDIDYNQKLAFSDDEADNDPSSSSGTTINKKDDNRKEQEKLAQEEKHALEEKEQLNAREKEREQKESSVVSGVRNEPPPRNDMQSLRSWNNQGPVPRSDFRGPPGPPPTNYAPQQSMRPNTYSLRAGGDEDEVINQRRREQVSEKVASTIERARQRKEEEEKRFQELTKQAAAKKLQDLENKLKEKHKQKDEEHHQGGQTNDNSNKPGPGSSAPASIIPLPDWERDREGRSRTSSTEGATKDADGKQSSTGQQSTSEFRQIDRPSFMRQQQQSAGEQSSTSGLTPGGVGSGSNRGERERERDRDRDQQGMREPAFSRHFQSNLPPRFQKQQAERSGAGTAGAPNNRLSPSAERSQPVSFSQQYDPSRWVHNHSNSLSSSMKSGHPLSAPSRRTRADSDVSGPLDDDSSGSSRPGSRVPPPMRSEDRDRERDRDRDRDRERDRDRPRHPNHRSVGGNYDHPRKEDSRYYDDYPRRGDRYKDDRYDYDDRHGRDSGSWADQREHSERRVYDDKPEGRDARDSRDSRDLRDRDLREKKDYDNYSKGPASQDSYDDQQPSSQLQHSRDGPVSRSESSVPEWRDDRRDIRSHDDRSSNDGGRRSGDLPRSTDEIQPQRNERPQRPDSRDSRASRESRTSLRGVDDDNFHKSSRDSGSSSWAACNDFSDYEDSKKQQRDIFREDIRDRDRDRERDRDRDRERDRDRDREGPSHPRDRRQPPGPVTKDKLDQEEVKRGLTQLKRGGPDAQDKKDNQSKIVEQSSNDSKKDSTNEPWNRNKPERTPENNNRSASDSIPKSSAWADAVSPTFEKEEEKRLMDSQHSNEDDKKMIELKQSIEKLSLDSNKRDHETSHSNDTDKDDQKDDKREKNARNRASSSGSRGSRGGEPRSARQWGSGGSGGGGNERAGGAFNVYAQRWRGSEAPARGRRPGGGPRSMGVRSGSAKGQGNYERTDSELSGDEPITGPPTESVKDERRSSSARSPKPSAPKGEKEERNRSAASTRKEDQQSQPLQQQQQGSRGGDFNQSSRNEKRSERNDYNEVRGGGRPSREGFAPSGEPSRRGRGGFRNNRGAAPPAGSAASGRMEGYGPPPSKSPFSSERAEDNKHSGNQQHSSTPTPSEHEDNGNATNQSESTDDKIIAKQQALNAGITGRHAKSPNQMNINHNNANSRGSKKEDARSKRTRSGSRRGRGGGAERNRASNNLVNNKQNNADPGNEDWETTSENSEEHTDERKDGHGGRPNKQYGGRSERQNSNIVNSNAQHPREPRGNRDREPRGEKGPKSSNPQSNRTSEKGRNAQNASERGGNRDGSQRSHHSGNIPSLMQNSQTQNGRPRSQGSANSGPISNKSMMNKDATVNRIDEIKLNDPNLVNQALNDINASKSKDKRGTNVDDIDSNCIGDDIGNTVDDKIDADGFQEVRSKKNVKDSSRQQQKDDQQSSKPGRRDRDKDRGGERDRSKSKTNGPQSQQGQQQGQNMSPLLGQAIGQAGPGAPSKQYDRNPRSQKLAPRFQKQRLAKQQQQQVGAPNESNDSTTSKPQNQQANTIKDTPGGVAPPPTTNAWDKPFTGGATNRSPPSPAIAAVPANIQLMSGLTPGGQTVEHEASQGESQQPTGTSTGSSQRNSPNIDKVATGKLAQVKESSGGQDKNATDTPVQTLIFENTNYSKNTKNSVGSAGDMAIKSKYSSNMKAQSRDKRSNDLEDDTQLQQQHQQQALSVAFSSKPNDLVKDKLPQQQQEPIQMPLSFNNKEDNADMKLDFTFDSDLSQLTEDKTKSLAMPRSMHMTGGQSTISPSTAELNLKIASVKKVWENAPPMPTVVEHEVDGNVVSTANSFPQAFESNDVDDGYSTHQQYNQSNMKNEITTSTNVCKVKPQQQSSGGGGAQPGSSVPGPSPIGPGQSPIGHPPASLQGPLSPPPFNSTGQPSHINYQEFAQYPGSQAAQYGSMPAIPSPPAVLFNTGSGQLPAQAGGLYGAFQLDQSRSPFTQYPPYAASLQNSFNQQNMYLQQPPPPHAPNAPTPDIYQSNLSQYRLTAAAAPPFGQNQQLSNNPNTVLISSSSNSLMSATVKPSSQPIGAIGTKAPHFQAPSAPPQPNQLAYIPYDPNQVLGVSGSYMGNSQLVQRPGPNVQPSANNYYSATSADVFSGSQTGFYQPGGTAQQTGAHYSLQGFGQHSQSLATGNAAPVGLQNFSSQFLSGSGLQIAAAAAQQYRNPTSGLPGPANAAATFLSKHQQQEQPRQLKSPSGNQQDVLSVFSSTSPKSRKQQSSSQQPQPSPTQHHKFPQYQNVNQSALQQNVRGMGMPPRGGIQPSQQRYPPPIQRPVVPFPGPNNSQQGQQQQQTCIPNQQQSQMNRHRPNIHQQQQQQRNMKMQQQYYSGQSNVKMDSNDKVDSHNDKISDNNAGNQSSGNKSNANPSEGDNKEEVNQQNE